MEANDVEFETLVVAMVTRFGAQVGGVALPGTLARFAAELRRLVESRGLPRPLGAGEIGAPGGMAEAELAPLLAQVTAGIEAPWLVDAARQLVKACFYPEFTVCRDSYREVGRDGACRRQEMARARGRISGSHCVDCPHWVALSPGDHGALLLREWRGVSEGFASNRRVFLPEDFRAFRLWLRAAARRAPGGR